MPSSGTTAGGTAVTITGTNLGGATGVSFGGAAGRSPLTRHADHGHQPAGTGTVSVTVTTPGGSATRASSPTSPRPAISAISPSSGTTDGGTTVTITGTNLTGATSVGFGGAAGRIISDSATQVTVTSPAGKGTVNITVTTAAGTSAVTAACQYTYMAPVLN